MQTSPSESRLTNRRWSQIVHALLAILWIAGSGVLSVKADRATFDPTRTQVAFPLATPPTIDGNIETSEWDHAGGFNGQWRVQPDTTALDGINGGIIAFGPVPDNADDLSFTISAGYDATNLYIAVQVRDSVIITDTADAGSKNGNTWQDDSVEVFVDGNNANDAAWSTNNPGGQFVITANNAYREQEAGNPGYGPNAAWYAQAAPRADGSGYDAEFRISLATLGNPKPGDIIGFTVGVNDDDDGGPAAKRQVLWTGEPHKPVTYGNLLLGPRSYTAPLVTTAPVVDGKIDPAEYAGAAKVHLGGAVGIWDIPAGEDTIPEASLNYDWWVVHTADAIYVAANVVDDQVINDNADAGPGSEDGTTWEDDSVEIFFDGDNNKNNGRGDFNFEGQYVFTANGARRDNEASNPTFGTNSDEWFAATSRTATGYQVEFRIPKVNLQNPTNGFTMGFLIAVNDDNGPGPLLPGDQLTWFGASHRELTYGNLTLSGASSPPTNAELRIVETKPDLTTGNITLTWEGDGPQFQVEKAATVTGTFQPLGAVQSGRVYIDAGALKSAALSFYRIRQVSGQQPPPVTECVSTPAINVWVNTPFANQAGTFTATFDATPSLDAPFDGVMALSAGSGAAFTDFACLTRFNTGGTIDARNGPAYAAASVIPYSANVKYSFRMVVNVAAHTYSTYVTPAGGAEITVGTDFAFRSEQSTVGNLANLGAIVDITAGSNTVCNFKVSPAVPAATCITTPAINVWVNTPFTNQTGNFTATFDATPSLDAPFDGVMALSSGPGAAFTDFACLTRFSTAGVIDARNGAGYQAASVIPYSANVKYSFRMVVNVPAHTYSTYVTPAEGTEITVGTDFAFRSEQSSVGNLANLGAIVDITSGTNTVCNFKVAPVVTPAACITTPDIDVWTNTPFADQTGTFSVQFDATPSADLIDSVMALSSGPGAAFPDFACLTRFFTDGFIEARNGADYAPLPGVIPYSANVKYSFRLVINVPAHTYSIYVTPAGGTEQTVGTDFDFRSEQSTVASLNNWGAIVTSAGAAGTNTVCNFKVGP